MWIEAGYAYRTCFSLKILQYVYEDDVGALNMSNVLENVFHCLINVNSFCCCILLIRISRKS